MPMLIAGTGHNMKHGWHGKEHYVASIRMLLSKGYRHFDTAEVYQGFNLLFKAFDEVPRRDLFITSKVDVTLWQRRHACSRNGTGCYQMVFKAVDNILTTLHLDWIDLMLLHRPPIVELIDGEADYLGQCMRIAEQWRGLEARLNQGTVRAIGVSNYCIGCLECLPENGNISVIQEMLHLGMGPDPLGIRSWAIMRKVVFVAYSVLGGITGDLAKITGGEDVKRLARIHNVSGAEVAMKWVAQLHIPMIVLASSELHAEKNLFLFESSKWHLSSQDVQVLSKLDYPPGVPSLWGDCVDQQAPTTVPATHQGLLNDVQMCIRQTAVVLSTQRPDWDSACLAQSAVFNTQAEILKPVWDAAFVKGFDVALWCATFFAKYPFWNMSVCPTTCDASSSVNPREHTRYKVIGPFTETDAVGRAESSLIAPVSLPDSVMEPFGFHPLEISDNDNQHVHMSCAYCSSLYKLLGTPEQFRQNVLPESNGHHAWMDLHPFGIYLANRMVSLSTRAFDMLTNISTRYWADEEPLHGFIWTILQLPTIGNIIDGLQPLEWASQFCAALLPHRGVEIQLKLLFECAHASGHGFFHRFGLSSAIDGCNNASMPMFTGDTWKAKTPPSRIWQNGCVSGAFHTFYTNLSFGTSSTTEICDTFDHSPELRRWCEHGYGSNRLAELQSLKAMCR